MSAQDNNKKDNLRPPDSFKKYYLRMARMRRDIKIRKQNHYKELHGEYWEYYMLEDSKLSIELHGEYYYN